MLVGEKTLDFLIQDIKNKDIPEIGCGAAEFSMAAQRVARSVACLDLDRFRLASQFAASGGPFH